MQTSFGQETGMTGKSKRSMMGLLCAVLAVGFAAVPAARAGAPAKAPSSGRIILDEGSLWRAFYTWRTPLTRKGKELKEGPRDGYGLSFAARTSPPPADWHQPDFDDAAWSRLRITRHGRVDYGFKGTGGPTLSLFCLRARFKVADPAGVRGLKLSLAYRGGAAIYVNGREVTRAYLPKGKPIAADTLADDYPPEAFVRANRKYIQMYAVHDGGAVRTDAEGLAKRIRKLEEVEIKPGLLRKGVNVLAVELHRAPYYGNGLRKENMNHMTVWGTCGLVRLSLRAEAGVEPNRRRPKGVQVWSTGVLHRASFMDYADPLEKPAPVRITGCRNGSFTGKVMVTSDRPLAGVKAEMSELRHKDGKAVIPASGVKVLYLIRDDALLMGHRMSGGFWDMLLETPPARVGPAKLRRGKVAGAVQPIIVRVRVPADAAPGDYAGKLTVTAGAAPVAVPVRLRVVDWRLPNPSEFVTHMGIIQSPDSVALRYKVPMWSEEHWKLMEKSFKLMGQLGNKYVVLPLIARTNFGNEQSMVRWVKNGKGYKHDFTNFDRYLDLARKHQKMDAVCLYLWDRYTGSHTWAGVEAGEQPRVTCWDPKTRKAEEMKAPKFESPEGKKVWGPLCREAVRRIEKRGLGKAAMLGMSAEWLPTKQMAAAFLEFWPQARWVVNRHADSRGGSVFGLPVAYNTTVYVILFAPPGQGGRGAKDGRYFGWQQKSDLFPRAYGPATYNPLWPSAHLGVHRIITEAAFLANFSGLGRTGADFWPVLSRDFKAVKIGGNRKRSYTITARFPNSSWHQLNMDTATEALLAPGPKGPVATERFEQVREGIQDSEARVFIEKAILSGKLDAGTVKKCWQVLDERAWRIRAGCSSTGIRGGCTGTWNYYEGAGSAGLAEKLYSCAAEVAAKVGAK